MKYVVLYSVTTRRQITQCVVSEQVDKVNTDESAEKEWMNIKHMVNHAAKEA